MPSRQSKVSAINALSFSDFEGKYIPSKLLSYTTSTDARDESYHITFKMTQTTRAASSKLTAINSQHEMTNSELEACFDLISRTSAQDYENSSLGWKPAAKRSEMREEDMRYLLLRRQEAEKASSVKTPQGSEADNSQKAATITHSNPALLSPKDDSILGFMSFMITIEEAQDVLYVYEIHLEESLRGLGLGRQLFQIAERVGAASGMEKVMLTVFRRNEGARKMYKRLGYEVDDCSPRARRLRGGVVKEVDYSILSKVLSSSDDATEDQAEDGRKKKRRRKGSL